MKIAVRRECSGRFLSNSAYSEILEFNGIRDAESLYSLQGEAVKKKLAERGTEKVLLKIPGSDSMMEAFMKRYLPLPAKEYLKSLISFKPLFRNGAIHEWDAIVLFAEKDIPAIIPIAAGKTDTGTCILTEGIRDYRRASDIFANFADSDFRRKRRLITRIAELAGRMHAANFAHQDFYLVHIFVTGKNDESVHIIDLQRVIIQNSLSRRWRVKDIGQLLYSAHGLVTKSDCMHFWKTYSEIAGESLFRDRPLISAIFAKASRIGRRGRKKGGG